MMIIQGKCPYHHDCLEGLAAGPAIEERWGDKGINLVDRPEVWDLEGYYIAQAIDALYFDSFTEKDYSWWGSDEAKTSIFFYL